MLELIAEAGLFDVAACAAVEHDEVTHQLRRIAALAFDEARGGDPGAHYDLLLRSRT